MYSGIIHIAMNVVMNDILQRLAMDFIYVITF